MLFNLEKVRFQRFPPSRANINPPTKPPSTKVSKLSHLWWKLANLSCKMRQGSVGSSKASRQEAQTLESKNTSRGGRKAHINCTISGDSRSSHKLTSILSHTALRRLRGQSIIWSTIQNLCSILLFIA